MFDRRAHTIQVLRALAEFAEVKKPDEFYSSAPGDTVRRAAMSYQIYREHYTELCELEDDSDAECLEQLDELISPITDIAYNGLAWLGNNPDTDRTWKRVRKLAAQGVALLESLPAPKKPARVAKLDLPVEHYGRSRVDNPPTPGEAVEGPDGISENAVNWYSLRDGLRAALGMHGLVGPDEPTDKPHLFLCEDRYNEERYHYAEVYSRAVFTLDWLRDVTRRLGEFPGWGLAVKNLNGAYLLIFADRLMVTGAPFRGCKDAASVLKVTKTLI